MLQFFSRRQFNQGLALIMLTFVVFHALSAHQGFADTTWSDGAPLAQLFYGLTSDSWISNKWMTMLFSGILIILQLLLVYRIVSAIKNLDKYNLMVTWVYLLLLYTFSAWNDFTPALVVQTMLLYVLYSIYKLNDLQKDSFLFTASSLLGLSFLLWYPSILLLPFVLVLLFQYNALSIKKLSILLLSFSIPIIWYLIYFWAQGQAKELFYQFATFYIHPLQIQTLSYQEWVPAGIIGLFSILGLVEAWSLSNKTAKTARLFISSLFSLLLFLGLGFMLSPIRPIYSFQAILFPMAFYIVLFVNNFKRPRFAEIAHIILLLAVLFNFAFQNFFQ